MSAVAIKISADFAQSVREAAQEADRSMTGQIEHWAKVGRGAEAMMPSPVASALKRNPSELVAKEELDMRAQVLKALENARHFTSDDWREKIGVASQLVIEPDPDCSGGFVRTHPDGTVEKGIVDGRKFIAK